MKKDFSDYEVLLFTGLALPAFSIIWIILFSAMQLTGVEILGQPNLLLIAGTLLTILSIYIQHYRKSLVSKFNLFDREKIRTLLRGTLAKHNIRRADGKRPIRKEDIADLIENVQTSLNEKEDQIKQFLEDNIFKTEHRTAICGVLISLIGAIDIPTYAFIFSISAMCFYLSKPYIALYRSTQKTK